MRNSVCAVLFDLGNTLVTYYRAGDFAPILRESIDSVCDFIEERKSAVDRERAFQHALKLNTEDPGYRVRSLVGRLVEIFSEHELAEGDLRTMCDTFLRPILNLGTLDAHALPTPAALRRKGIRTAIVSNTPWGSPAERWMEELRRYGLTEAVDATVFCVDVGWRKPAPQIFQHALSLLEVEPRDSVFVGDDPRQDIAGAERSGLRAILIDPPGAATRASCPVIHSLTELLPLLDAMTAE
ncbi:MAG TPA: HAD family hydrolase [Myxococcota bacterium]|nr:HAD family hydrolase [Myxococcota bacterium]